MSEVRPWVGSRLSLAQFQIRKSLTLVDCSSDEEEAWFHYGRLEGNPKQREKATWAAINRAFSELASRSHDVADYAPTQVIAEKSQREV